MVMLNSCDILFDEDLSMKFFAERIGKSINIILSDGLESSDEVLTDEYKKKIALFINDFEIWYDDVLNAIKDYFKRKGIIITLPDDVELMKIFVLFEQNEHHELLSAYTILTPWNHKLAISKPKQVHQVRNIKTRNV